MPKRPIVLPVLIASWPLAFAQEAAPTSRVQRDADNPLRVILEAGKLKPRKAGEVEKPPSRPERVQLRARAAVESAPAAASSARAGAAPLSAPASASTPASVSAASGARAEVRIESAATEVALPAAAPRESTSAELPPLPPLRVAQIVEPVLPRRIGERLRGDVEVVVAFTVQPDGSVRDVSIETSGNPSVNATVLQAVAQWRYAPIPAAREHKVQLLLRSGDN